MNERGCGEAQRPFVPSEGGTMYSVVAEWLAKAFESREAWADRMVRAEAELSVARRRERRKRGLRPLETKA